MRTSTATALGTGGRRRRGAGLRALGGRGVHGCAASTSPVLPAGQPPHARSCTCPTCTSSPASAKKQAWVRVAARPARPTRWSSPATSWPHPDAVPHVLRHPRPAASTCPAPSCSAATTTTRREPLNPARYLARAVPAASPKRPMLPWRRPRRRTAPRTAGSTSAMPARDHEDRRARASTCAAWTTRTSAATATPRWPGRSTPTPTSPWASRTRRTCASSTAWRPTAPTSSSPATPTAASCACPAIGALVTNCDLTAPAGEGAVAPWRLRAARVGGLGTSPYAPVRFACRPEATLLTLAPVPIYRSIRVKSAEVTPFGGPDPDLTQMLGQIGLGAEQGAVGVERRLAAEVGVEHRASPCGCRPSRTRSIRPAIDFPS